MSDFKDIKVGDTVWIEGGFRRGEIAEVPVGRVGLLYFYTNYGKYNEKKFHIENGREFVGPNDVGHYAMTAWLLKEEYERYVEQTSDRNKMESFFRDYSKPKNLTHEQVRAILNIIEP